MVGEAIELFFKKHNFLFDNVFIVSNAFLWDNDKAVGVRQPIIHSLNKNEILVKDFLEIFEQVENRRNVLLIGDSVDDVDMIEGFECDNLIKIGFLNEKVEENLENYKKNFDIVILNDGPMDSINGLLEQIISG